ncbi:MAG TPA: hypothetical protein V6D27_00755 [Vampirovibrionales bacterium]
MPDDFEIFQGGTRTSSDGRKIHFSNRDLDEIVETYDPRNFRAPLILSHNTFARSDRELAESELAFGVVQRVVRDGNSLRAFCDPIAPEVSQWIKEGRIVDRSASFYPPDSPSNPTPGKWSLRHVALLGRTPPAVKGMSALSLAEIFDDDGGEALEFKGYEMNTQTVIADFFRGVRDFLIESQGLEFADNLLPSDKLATLSDQENADLPSDFAERLADLEEEIESLKEHSANKQQTMGPEYQELQDELESYKTQLRNERTQRRNERIASFEEKYKDRLTPAMLAPVEVSFGEESRQESFSSWCESLSDWQLSYVENFIKNLPPQIDFGEHTAGGGGTDRPAERRKYSSSYDAASLAADAKIRDYQSQHPELTYSEVVARPEFQELLREIL